MSKRTSKMKYSNMISVNSKRNSVNNDQNTLKAVKLPAIDPFRKMSTEVCHQQVHPSHKSKSLKKIHSVKDIQLEPRSMQLTLLMDRLDKLQHKQQKMLCDYFKVRQYKMQFQNRLTPRNNLH